MSHLFNLSLRGTVHILKVNNQLQKIPSKSLEKDNVQQFNKLQG